MLELSAAALFFVGTHLGISGTPLRAKLVERLGAGPYRALYSLVALVGIVWLVSAYARAEHVALWGQLLGWRPLVLALMALSVFFVVVGLATPSPTAVAGERLAGRPPRGILTLTRHPFLWGVSIWAFAHGRVNGDLGSLILFASLLVLSLAGTVSIDHKRAARPDWPAFRDATSNVPFAAILSGRVRLDLAGIGWWRPLAALGVYVVLALAHGPVIGVPAVVHG
jgi:uncharacterized membrane protein